MSASDDVRREILKLEAMTQDVFVGVGTEALRSIQGGSELTGAPGQPVDTGYLKGSWQRTFPSATQQAIGTNAAYAQGIEDGVGPHGPIQLRSAVGGFHSVALTVAGLPRIVESEVHRVARSQGRPVDGSFGFSGEDGG